MAVRSASPAAEQLVAVLHLLRSCSVFTRLPSASTAKAQNCATVGLPFGPVHSATACRFTVTHTDWPGFWRCHAAQRAVHVEIHLHAGGLQLDPAHLRPVALCASGLPGVAGCGVGLASVRRPGGRTARAYRLSRREPAAGHRCDAGVVRSRSGRPAAPAPAGCRPARRPARSPPATSAPSFIPDLDPHAIPRSSGPRGMTRRHSTATRSESPSWSRARGRRSPRPARLAGLLGRHKKYQTATSACRNQEQQWHDQAPATATPSHRLDVHHLRACHYRPPPERPPPARRRYPPGFPGRQPVEIGPAGTAGIVARSAMKSRHALVVAVALVAEDVAGHRIHRRAHPGEIHPVASARRIAGERAPLLEEGQLGGVGAPVRVGGAEADRAEDARRGR